MDDTMDRLLARLGRARNQEEAEGKTAEQHRRRQQI
jgi:hypothetical protein